MRRKMTREEWQTEVSSNFNRRMGCIDCGTEDRYMLYDDVWKKAFPNYAEVVKKRKKEDPRNSTNLCLSCVERRLKRPLVITDFVKYPINKGIFWGYKMAVRKLK